MSPSIIYFIKPKGMAGPIKIGCSDRPPKRLEALAHWSPFELEIIVTIPGTIKLEGNIHECFADVHSHHEWFHPSTELLVAIEKLKAGIPVGEAIDLSARKGQIRRRIGNRYWPPHKRRGTSLRFKAMHLQQRTEMRLHPDLEEIFDQIYRGQPVSDDAEKYVSKFLSDPESCLISWDEWRDLMGYEKPRVRVRAEAA